MIKASLPPFEEFIDIISRKLMQPLPGFQSQMKMVPVTRKHYLQEGMDVSKARKAAVLILLYPKGKSINTVLILRPTYDGVHSGQVSLPGGKKEPADTTLQQTALRESEEEIGIPQSEIKVIGELTEIFIPPSNYNVLPVLGHLMEEPVFKPELSEVSKVIPVGLELLLSDQVIREEIIKTRDNLQVAVPCFYIKDHVVWGATAMILSEFIEIIKY